MANLLIYSITEFSELVLKTLELTNARELVELGAAEGKMSAVLAEYCRSRGGHLTCVDPKPHPELLAWLESNAEVSYLETRSLDAIAGLTNVDCWLIDGDHNWYTVYHELLKIREACRRDQRPLLVILHDVGWPTARRDMYYAPEQIPAEYRHPHSFDDGVTLGSQYLVKCGGFRGMGAFAFAKAEGGPRNGVLTAIEDFLKGTGGVANELQYFEIPAIFGLGVLFDSEATWSSSLSELLLPFHQNTILHTLEQNRLRNYLRVIELQDEFERLLGER